MIEPTRRKTPRTPANTPRTPRAAWAPGGGGVSYAAWKRAKVKEAHEKGGCRKTDVVAEQMMFDVIRSKAIEAQEEGMSQSDVRPPSSATSASIAGADRSTEIDRLIEGLNLNEMRQGTPMSRRSSRGPSMELDETRRGNRIQSWTPDSMEQGVPSLQVLVD